MPHPASLDFYLEVLDPRGRISRFMLLEKSAIIGRGADARVRLDSTEVSRHHAELTQDDLGQWLVRDLKSRNGTFVNDEQVEPDERAVNWRRVEPGDRITIGDFALTLLVDTPGLDWAMDHQVSYTNVSLDETPAGPMGGMAEVSRIQTEQLMTIGSFGLQLMQIESPGKRLKAVCDLMLHPALHGLAAMGLRLSREPQSKPQPLCEPRYSSRLQPGSTIHLSRGLLHQVMASGQAALATPQGGGQAIEISVTTSRPMALMACPLASSRQVMDVLYVAVEPDYGTPDWLALVFLAAKQYEQAGYSWRRMQSEK